MNKPLSIVVEDAKRDLRVAINNLNLSPTILLYVMRDLYDEVKEVQEDELKSDLMKMRESYEKRLQDERMNETPN